MLSVAIDAAKQAGDLALKYFKSQPKVSYKPDKSPVTRADIEAEKLIRKIIAKNFPDHGIIGEELPPVNPKAKYRWVIDPIDGTRDFIRRIPYWAVYIAVLDKQKPIISVVNLPAIGKLITAKKNKGTFLNNKKVHVSKVEKLADAYMSYGSIKRFQRLNQVDLLIKLTKNTRTARSHENLGLILLLEASMDMYIDPYGHIHDFAAPALLVEEAGGKFSDFEGKELLTSGNIIFSNGLLHDQVLKLLNEK